MTRFWAKFYLWLHGYCTKHGIPKTNACTLADVDVFCERCEDERGDRVEGRIRGALNALGFTDTPSAPRD